jgi:hypothetical protein
LVEIGKNTEKVGALHPSDGTEDAHYQAIEEKNGVHDWPQNS